MLPGALVLNAPPQLTPMQLQALLALARQRAAASPAQPGLVGGFPLLGPVLGPVFDLLSRPRYAAANAALALARGNVMDVPGAIVRGALGQQPTGWRDVAMQLGIPDQPLPGVNPSTFLLGAITPANVLGLAGDIALDPLNLVGAGAVRGAAGLLGRAAEHVPAPVQAAAAAARATGPARTAESLVGDVGRYLDPRFGASAPVSAINLEARPLRRGMDTESQRWWTENVVRRADARQRAQAQLASDTYATRKWLEILGTRAAGGDAEALGQYNQLVADLRGRQARYASQVAGGALGPVQTPITQGAADQIAAILEGHGPLPPPMVPPRPSPGPTPRPAAPVAPAAPIAPATPAPPASAPPATVAPVAPAPSTPAPSPSTTFAFGNEPGVTYQFRYRVADLNNVVPSHADNLVENPAYPQDLQPRQRGRFASQDQIRHIAATLNPDWLLSDVRTLDRGIPIVGPDLVVESGNGRILALRQAALTKPERYRAYLDALEQRLPEYGLSAADLKGIRAPVLVRERTTPVDRVAFAQEANQPAILAMSPFEQALNDARKVNPATIGNIAVTETQSLDQALRSGTNQHIVHDFMQGMPATERAGLLDAHGNLNALGMERLKSALFAWVYQGDAGQRLTEAFRESMDPDLKTVQQALQASLPAAARVEAMVRGGQRDAAYSLAPDLANAVNTLGDMRAADTPLADYLSQGTMWERTTSPFQDELMRVLDRYGRAPKQLRELLMRYYDAVLGQKNMAQGGLFGDVAPRPRGELLDEAARQQGFTSSRFAAADAASPITPTAAQEAPAAANAPVSAGLVTAPPRAAPAPPPAVAPVVPAAPPAQPPGVLPPTAAAAAPPPPPPPPPPAPGFVAPPNPLPADPLVQRLAGRIGQREVMEAQAGVAPETQVAGLYVARSTVRPRGENIMRRGLAPGGGGGIVTNVGPAEEARVFPTVQIGMAEGQQYHDLAPAGLVREYRGNRAIVSQHLLDSVRGLIGDANDPNAIFKEVPEGQPLPADWRPLQIPAFWRTGENGTAIGLAGRQNDVHAIESLYKVATRPGDLETLGKLAQRVTQAWKLSVTLPFPAYHVINFTGNLWGMYLAGVGPLEAYRDMRDGWTIQQGRALRDLPAGWTHNDVRHFADQVVHTGLFSSMKIDQVAKAMGEHGPDRLRRLLETGGEWAQAFSGAYEDNAKLAVMLNYARKHPGPAVEVGPRAVNQAMKYLYDYGDMPASFRAATILAPFLTWTVKNTPTQVEQLVRQPLKFRNLAAFYNFLDQSERVNPNALAVLANDKTVDPTLVLGQDEHGRLSTIRSGLRLPVEDLNLLAGMPGVPELAQLVSGQRVQPGSTEAAGLNRLLGLVNPLIKLPAEELTNHSFFTGDQLDDPRLNNYFRQADPLINSIPWLRDYLKVREVTRYDNQNKPYTVYLSDNPRGMDALLAIGGRFYTAAKRFARNLSPGEEGLNPLSFVAALGAMLTPIAPSRYDPTVGAGQTVDTERVQQDYLGRLEQAAQLPDASLTTFNKGMSRAAAERAASYRTLDAQQAAQAPTPPAVQEARAALLSPERQAGEEAGKLNPADFASDGAYWQAVRAVYAAHGVPFGQTPRRLERLALQVSPPAASFLRQRAGALDALAPYRALHDQVLAEADHPELIRTYERLVAQDPARARAFKARYGEPIAAFERALRQAQRGLRQSSPAVEQALQALYGRAPMQQAG